MTEPMRETEDRIKAFIHWKLMEPNLLVDDRQMWNEFKYVLDSKDSLIQAKEERIKGLEAEGEMLEKDLSSHKQTADQIANVLIRSKAQENISLRTLVKELGRALEAMTEFQPKRVGSTLYRKDSICHTASPSEHDNTDEAKEACYICKALLLIPEELRKP